jgi:hypothetical protein
MFSKTQALSLLALLGVIFFLVFFLLVRERRESTSSTEAKDTQGVQTEAHAQRSGIPAHKVGKSGERGVESFETSERNVLSNPDPSERISAVEELTESKNRTGAVAALLQVLHNDSEAEVRKAALEGLEELEGLSLETLSQAALTDPEADIRVRAVELLGEIDEKGKRTAELLKRIAKMDQNKEVRQAAMDLLEEIGRGN